MARGYLAVTRLIRSFSLTDRGMNLVSSSAVVIRLRNCHFQSFQSSLGMWVKNALWSDGGVLLGGSSSSDACLVTGVLGGSSSTFSNWLFRSVPDFTFLLLIASKLNDAY